MTLEEKMQADDQGVVVGRHRSAHRRAWLGLMLLPLVVLAASLAVIAARHRPLNRKDFPKLNALQWAAVTNDPAECERLVRAGTPIDAADVDGETALHEAVFWCHIDVVLKLLDLGADPHHLDHFKRSPIMAAESVIDGGKGSGTLEEYAAILKVLKRDNLLRSLAPSSKNSAP